MTQASLLISCASWQGVSEHAGVTCCWHVVVGCALNVTLAQCVDCASLLMTLLTLALCAPPNPPGAGD